METKDEPTDIVMLFVRAAGMKCGKAGNTFGAADPFFEVKNDDSKIVARSVIFRNDLNPQWPPIKLDLDALCQGDPTRKITLAFYDWNKNDEHELLGEVSTDLDEMKQAAHSYQSQRSVGFLDKQGAYDLGKSGRVFIYDIIQTTGVPTVGTLKKEKSFESNVPSETDTEPETDSNAQSFSSDDPDEAIMTPEDVSVCPSVVSVASRASTIMHANGDASPRSKAKPTFEPIRVTKYSPTRGKSLFSGNIIGRTAPTPVGPLENQQAIPIEREMGDDAVILDELKGSMESSPALEPLLAAEQRGAEMALHEVADESRHHETASGELRGVVEENEEHQIGDTGDSAIAENVRDLLCEIGDLLGQVNMKTPKRKPRNEPKAPQVSLLPLRRGSNGSIPTKTATCPDESSSQSRGSPGSKPPPSKPLSLTVAEELLMPLCDVSDCDVPREKASLDDAQLLMNLMKGDGSIAKTKQCLDRPKKEYLSY